MKKLLIAFALTLGIIGVSKAEDRAYQGWNVTIVTGTHANIFSGRGYLYALVNGSDTLTSGGNYAQAFSSAPNVGNGGGATSFGTELFVATAALTPPIVFGTTSTVNGANGLNTSLAVKWSIGDCPTCFVEVPGTGGLTIRRTNNMSGAAGQTAVYWSK